MATNDLLNHVQHIADTLTNPSESYEDEYGDIKGDAFDYLSDALDFEWVLASDKKTLLGARILVAFGGPNIWINTRTKTVEGHWWGESATVSYEDSIGLEDALETIFHC